MDNTIHVILTGGTIDSHWDGTRDTAIPNEHSVIPSYIESLKLYPSVIFTEMVMKDSRDLNDADMQRLLEIIETSQAARIIITHGTYTMADTAKFLQNNAKRKDQTIILTGSMIPMQNFSISDAPFNLGFALALSQQLPPGVYVCMNGKSFAAEQVAKDTEEGRFYSIVQN